MPSITPIVIRRVGGLEVRKIWTPDLDPVIRRVGGLEEEHGKHHLSLLVIRRVGGLEVAAC